MKILQDVVNHWKNDWVNNRRMFWFESVGTLLSILATAIMSFGAAMPPMLLCYSLWFMGSSMIMIGAYMRQASWMFVLMAFNTVLNIVGLSVLMLF